MTVLVYSLAPPLVLSPICLVIARWLWFRRTQTPTTSIARIIGVSFFEIILWISLSVSLVILMTGDAGRRVVPVPPISAGALWLLSRTGADPFRKASRWFYLLMPPLVLLVLLAATWLVIIYLEHARIL